MATTECTETQLTTPAQGLRTFVEAAFARVAAAWTAYRNRRSINQLLDWDSHMLADIGLTQGDVRSALAARFADDPSYKLSAFCGERKAAARAQARTLHVFND